MPTREGALGRFEARFRCRSVILECCFVEVSELDFWLPESAMVAEKEKQPSSTTRKILSLFMLIIISGLNNANLQQYPEYAKSTDGYRLVFAAFKQLIFK